MAEALYLLIKDFTPGEKRVDGVHAVLINSDDGGTDAQIRSEAVAQAVAAGFALPADYFDNVTPLEVSDLTAGVLDDDEDAYIFAANAGGGYVTKQEG